MDALDNGSSQTYTRQIWTDETDSQTITVTDTNSNQLTYIVLARKNWPLWHSPYWGNPTVNNNIVAGTLEDQWLQDSLADIALKLLSNDPSVTNPILVQMGQELQAWGEKITGWDAMTPQQRALLVASSLGGQLREMMSGLALIFGWIKSGGQWIIAKGQAMYANWRRGAEAIGDVVDEVMQRQVDPPPPGVPGMPAITGKGFLFLVGAVALGAQIWLLSDTWADASASKRGELIVGVIGSFNNLAKLGTDAIETILRRKGGTLDPAQQSICSRFDQEYGAFLENEGSILEVNQETGVAVAPEELVAENDFVEELGEEEMEELTSQWALIVGQKRDAFQAAMDAGYKAVRVNKAFSVVRGFLDCLGYVVGIGAAIFMTWQLVENWSMLSNTDRIFQTIQVVFAVIEGIGSVLMVGVSSFPLWAPPMDRWSPRPSLPYLIPLRMI